MPASSTMSWMGLVLALAVLSATFMTLYIRQDTTCTQVIKHDTTNKTLPEQAASPWEPPATITRMQNHARDPKTRLFLPAKNLPMLVESAKTQFQLSRIHYGHPDAPVKFTVVTRTYNREASLQRCLQTAAQLVVPDHTAWEHIVLRDLVGGSGMRLAETALYAFCDQYRGDYICHMDDDNYFLALDLLIQLQKICASWKGTQPGPAAIVAKAVRADLNQLPIYWERFPPFDGSIDTCNVWFRKDLYCQEQHAGVLAMNHAGDYALIHNFMTNVRREDVVWLDRLTTYIGDRPLITAQPIRYVTAELCGGLGNQLFQVAAAYSYAQQFGHTVAFTHLDELPTTTDTYRPTYFKNLLQNVPSFPETHPETKLCWNTIREQGFGYTKWHPHAGHVRLQGYWQAYRYVKPFLPTLRTLLLETGKAGSKPTETIPPTDEHKDEPIHVTYTTVAVHVRRGDYVTNPQHPVQPITYYEQALQHLQIHLPTQALLPIIFSDDPNWCQTHLLTKWPSAQLAPPGTDLDDFFRMSQCQHHIIANSTFSWWAAVLAEPGGLTVAPGQWFNPHAGGMIQNWQDLYAPHWTIIQ